MGDQRISKKMIVIYSATIAIVVLCIGSLLIATVFA